MICSKCNTTISDEARFCSNCGFELNHTNRISFGDIAQKINKVAGIDSPVKIKFREVFSKVFIKHSEEEAEKLFFVGTSQTTPMVENIVDTWPKPWLFARVFILVVLVYLGLYIGVEHFQNLNFLPGLITLGSFMVPLTLLIFFWEMNAPQNISIYKVIKMLFLGGVLSLVTAVFIFENIATSSDAIIVGIVEETAKVLALLWYLRETKHRFILNGLLIGAAIGTGFAAFESAGYALRTALYGDLDLMYSTLFWRGVLAPGGHVIWAALTGAAICLVKGNRPFQWSTLKDFRFVRIFLIVITLHAMWNMQWPTLGILPLAQIIFTVIAWIIAFGMMNEGLKEITMIKAQNNDSHQEHINEVEHSI